MWQVRWYNEESLVVRFLKWLRAPFLTAANLSTGADYASIITTRLCIEKPSMRTNCLISQLQAAYVKCLTAVRKQHMAVATAPCTLSVYDCTVLPGMWLPKKPLAINSAVLAAASARLVHEAIALCTTAAGDTQAILARLVRSFALVVKGVSARRAISRTWSLGLRARSAVALITSLFGRQPMDLFLADTSSTTRMRTPVTTTWGICS